MNEAVGAGVVWLVTTVLAGVVLTVTAPGWARSRPAANLRRRLSAAGAALEHGLGRPVAALGVVFAGSGAMLLVLWLLGELAQVVEPTVDVPLFDWFQARQGPPAWSSTWLFLTDIGSLDLTQRIVAVAAVVFALLYARRRWWAPPALLLSGYAVEKLGQEALKILVDRGHPPTTLGTWPSGGCARVAVVYGLVVFLTLRWFQVTSTRAWVAGWSVVATAEAVQAYARTVNLEHWFTDVLGGMVFGVLLVLTMTAAGAILLSAPSATGPAASEFPEARTADALLQH